MHYLKSMDKKVAGAMIIGTVIIIVAYVSSGGNFSFIGNLWGEKEGSTAGTQLSAVVRQDTDGDGVPDWEERLWGTNPLKKDTDENGIHDGEEIAKKKEAIQNDLPIPEDGTAGASQLSIVDKVTREILSAAFSLDETGNLNSETINNLSQNIAGSFSSGTSTNFYRKSDLNIAEETNDSLLKYRDDLENVFKLYVELGLGMELGPISELVSSKNVKENAEKILIAAKNYRHVSDVMTKTSVPSGLADLHLSFSNGYRAIGNSLDKIANVFEDPIIALQSLSEYGNRDREMAETFKKIETYLKNNGIIFNKGR